MRWIEQSFEIVHCPAQEEAVAEIERMARICYRSEDKIKEGSGERLIKSLISSGHHAMLEFGRVSVIIRTDRAIANELVRHRLCSFAQESTRWVEYSGIECIEGSAPDSEDGWDAINKCEDEYSLHINAGYAPQEARGLLPLALATTIGVSANFREWDAIFQLRTHKAAHPQMRKLMIGIQNELARRLPLFFSSPWPRRNIAEYPTE